MEEITLELDNSYLSTVKEEFNILILICYLPAEHQL